MDDVVNWAFGIVMSALLIGLMVVTFYGVAGFKSNSDCLAAGYSEGERDLYLNTWCLKEGDTKVLLD